VSIESINSPDTESGQWATTTLGDSSDNVDRLRIVAVGDAGNDPYYGYALGSTGASITVAGTVVNYAANSWYHAALVQKSSSGTTLYANGGVEGTSATSVNDPAFDQVGIGINASNTLDKPFSGKIAMGAVHTAERSTNYWSTVNSYWTSASFSTHGVSEAEPSAGETEWLEFTTVTSSTGWTNPANALASLLNAATDDVPDGTSTNALILTDLGGAASEVTGQTITGIEFEILAQGEDAGARELYDDVLRVYDAGAVGTDFGIGTQWTDGSTVTRYYGGAGNMLGTTIVDTDITASTFGITMTFASDGTEPALMSIYRVRVRFFYGAGGSSNDGSFFFGG